MKTRSLVAAANIGFMFLLMRGIKAEAAEIKVLSANGMRLIMQDLGPKFERATGHKLAIRYASAETNVKRIQEGETGDLVITPRPGIDTLMQEGKVVETPGAVVARSGISVAVPKGVPKPDISSPDALKRTLLAAKSICYTNPADGGASAIHFTRVLDRLGIANEMKPKTVFSSRVGDTVANGGAEIGVQQTQQLISVAGIEIVGPLPGDLQETIVFSAAIMSGARNSDAARALVDFLRAPEAAPVIKAMGMEPATP
jgi:molybdate transport system substrate-binding protein